MRGLRRFGWSAALLAVAGVVGVVACGSEDERPAPTAGEGGAGGGVIDAAPRLEAGAVGADAEAPPCIAQSAPQGECSCVVDVYEDGRFMVTLPCGGGLCVESRNDERYCTPEGRLIAFRGCMNDGGAIPLCDAGLTDAATD